MKLKIKEIRKENNVSQKDLAIFLNVGQQAVSNWENEKTEPDIETLEKIAKHFKVTLDYLIGKSLIRSVKNDYNKELAQLISQLDDKDKEILFNIIERLLMRK